MTSVAKSQEAACAATPQQQEPITFSFAAAGWLQMYLFGVGHAIAMHIPNARCQSIDVASPQALATADTSSSARAPPRYCGSSAGSLAAAAILTGADMERLGEYAATCAVHCRSRWYRAFMIRDYVKNGVEIFVAQQPALFRTKKAAPAPASATVGADPVEASVVAEDETVAAAMTAVLAAADPPLAPGHASSGISSVSSTAVGEEEEEDDVAALGRSTNSVESLLLASVAAEDAEIFTEEVQAAMAAQEGNGKVADALTDALSCDDIEDDDDEYDQYDRIAAAERERRAMAEVAEACGAVQGHKSVDQMQTRSRGLIAAGAAAGAVAAGDRLGMSATISRRRNRRFARALRMELRRRLEVYATALPRIRALIFSDFREVADVEEALVASCCITPLAGLPFRTRRTGDWVCDGGLAAFQPRAGAGHPADPNIITISALYFTGADISPSEVVPAWWGLYPPSDAEYRDLFDLGFNDALRALQAKGLIAAAVAEAAVRPRTHKLRPRGVTGLVADTFAAIAYFLLRAFAMCLVYGELALVASVCLGVTVFHTWFPNAFEALLLTSRSYRRSEGGRFAALKDYIALALQFANARVLLHLAFGRRLDNSKAQLERYSRIYRVVKPLMG